MSRDAWKPLPDTYCPHCGERAVWFEDDGGDYYLGEDHACISCGEAFYLQPGSITPLELARLRAKAAEPVST